MNKVNKPQFDPTAEDFSGIELFKFLGTPRPTAQVEDYPLGSGCTGIAKFYMKRSGNRGVKVFRETENRKRMGTFCNPKSLPYVEHASFFVAEDGHVYTGTLHFGRAVLYNGTMKQTLGASYYVGRSITAYNTLLDLIKSVSV